MRRRVADRRCRRNRWPANRHFSAGICASAAIGAQASGWTVRPHRCRGRHWRTGDLLASQRRIRSTRPSTSSRRNKPALCRSRKCSTFQPRLARPTRNRPDAQRARARNRTGCGFEELSRSHSTERIAVLHGRRGRFWRRRRLFATPLLAQAVFKVIVAAAGGVGVAAVEQIFKLSRSLVAVCRDCGS